MILAHGGPPQPLPSWVFPWVFVASPFWYCFVVFLISRVGGWHALAQRFPAGAEPPAGITYGWRNGWIGPLGTRYNNCLNVTFTGKGLYVVPLLLFRLFHPPLLLPWSCVTNVGERKFLVWRALEMRCFVDKRTLTLYLPTEAAAHLPPAPPPLMGSK